MNCSHNIFIERLAGALRGMDRSGEAGKIFNNSEEYMASLNKVIIIGRIGKDPEIRHTQSGQAVATLSVATDESYKDQSGQKIEKTEWHKIVVWGKQADFVANYLGKGRLVYVEGKLETRKWQDQGGQDRYSTEVKAVTVQSLDKKPDGQTAPQQQAQQYNAKDDMDDIPF